MEKRRKSSLSTYKRMGICDGKITFVFTCGDCHEDTSMVFDATSPLARLHPQEVTCGKCGKTNFYVHQSGIRKEEVEFLRAKRDVECQGPNPSQDVPVESTNDLLERFIAIARSKGKPVKRGKSVRTRRKKVRQ